MRFDQIKRKIERLCFPCLAKLDDAIKEHSAESRKTLVGIRICNLALGNLGPKKQGDLCSDFHKRVSIS